MGGLCTTEGQGQVWVSRISLWGSCENGLMGSARRLVAREETGVVVWNE